ncbi:MAG TPA: bifunctional UDP-N-acetylglucosamine diphosphorylase/glucosamine-1-phosphate N-acetyltransferase GlmU [Firmicutes bacterium]|nr:bifunctional UDP-N-acetylglucosamine diphosphorylase/glucosamine-1-phosphate N-acetyltransferase GlmU [Bacillota bacterium]
MSGFRAIVLAAGLGKRMKSSMPKVLHKVCGRPIIFYVLDAVSTAGASNVIVVVGHRGELVEEAVADWESRFNGQENSQGNGRKDGQENAREGSLEGRLEGSLEGRRGESLGAFSEIGPRVRCVYQREQLGTAHAVMQAAGEFRDYDGPVVVVAGDMPFLPAGYIRRLVDVLESGGANSIPVSAVVLTAIMEEPQGYGRIVRGEDGRVLRVVEEKDATPEEKAIHEINSSAYCFNAKDIFCILSEVSRDNAQGEYYLTDVIRIMTGHGMRVEAEVAPDPVTVMGINTRMELAKAEEIMRDRVRRSLMEEGVTMIDPRSTFIDAGVKIGRDTVVYPFTFIEGKTVIGEGCTIGPEARLVNVTVEDGARIERAVVYSSIIGRNANVGPFAYIRPGTVLKEKSKVGTFVEVKKSTIGPGSKVPHQSYIGDTTIGTGVNVGAGTITCNYDGREKHPTIIDDEVFIGSNTNLVAPVRVGKGAYVAAGSTITQDVPAGALGIARGHQRNIEGWIERRRQKNSDVSSGDHADGGT